MGWQQDQAAARAREQQRQMFQNQQSRQRANDIRAENDAANRRARQVREEGFARANARADQQRRASAAAETTRAHKAAMRNAAQTGQGWWGSSSAAAAGSRSDHESETLRGGGAGTTKKKGGSGALLLIAIVIGFVVLANSNAHRPTNAEQPAATRFSGIPSGAQQPSAPQPPAQPPAPAQAAPPAETPSVQPSADNGLSTGGEADSAPGRQAEPLTGLPGISAPTLAPPLPPLEVVTRVSPQYPELARQSGVHGIVAVIVGVSSNGAVVTTNASSGNPILAPAALYAARQWRFNPYAARPGDPLRTMAINFKFGDQ